MAATDQRPEDNPDELPSVEDRTLFLGCLTCIVASAYDYDLTVEGSKSAANGGRNSIAEATSKLTPKQFANQASMYFDDSERGSASTEKEGGAEVETEGETDDDEEEDDEQKKLEQDLARAMKINEKMKLAEQRYLVRRYTVAKDFIKQSAKHLLLEEEEVVTRDFLPQLDVLLESNEEGKQELVSSSSASKLQDVLKNPESHAKERAKQYYHTSASLQSLDWVQDNEQLQTYLQEIDPPVAYKCLVWLLFQHLLNDSGTKGYDARIRFWFKTLGVTLWLQQMESDDGQKYSQKLVRATRKFEALEKCCADRLLTLAATEQAKQQDGTEDNDNSKRKSSSLGSNIWKGVQIGGVGVGAGILLAVTGGLAAPGIAIGLTALGLGAVAGTFLSLASSAAVVTLFGVAGGSLAAYKMNRRISGLTEFAIQQELLPAVASDGKAGNDKNKQQQPQQPQAQLFRTIGISGWLQDKCDFQRPWGVTPTNPPITNKVELLQRFYYVHNPQLVEAADEIWAVHKSDPDKLWKLLEYKYGCTPDNIFCKRDTPKEAASSATYCLTDAEIKKLDQIIVAIGNVKGGEKGAKEKPTTQKQKQQPKEDRKKKKGSRFSTFGGWGSTKKKESDGKESLPSEKKDNSSRVAHQSKEKKLEKKGTPKEEPTTTKKVEDMDDSERNPRMVSDFEMVDTDHTGDYFHREPPKDHLTTVWNYSRTYGGELYTVKWESDLLEELSASIRRLALDLASSAGQQVLKTTVAATLIVAAALPLTIVGAMNAIDGTWTLVIQRSDQAGKELARSLLVNKGGHRPVTLIGYSFGARIIYTCLKELAEYQQKWEEHQIEKRQREATEDGSAAKDDKNKKKDVCKVGDLEFDREPASIVEDAIMMGMPKYVGLPVWKACREVVAGRLVNVYSRKDKVLSYMFKYKQLLGSYQPVVGTCTVAVQGVENIDVTDLVSSHDEYSAFTGKILERVRLGQPVRASSHALDEVALMEEAEILAKEDSKDEEETAASGAANETEDEA